MSRDIIVLMPNGRRQKVHCTPDTSILQVLEDACQKQGFQPTDYDLKHHNHILDLTTTVRFSNLPNKATLEMVETEHKRKESDVTIGLLLEDGERRTADFPPNTSLYDLITSLAATELSSLQHPTILYMRQEVSGLSALKEKTLRQLGLIGGRAILRLLNKAEEATQANVSAVYRRPHLENTKNAKNEEKIDSAQSILTSDEALLPGPSTLCKRVENKTFNPINLIKSENLTPTENIQINSEQYEQKEIAIPANNNQNNELINKGTLEKQDQCDSINKESTVSKTSSTTQEYLERRLKIEEEVTFLGSKKAIAFMQPENTEDDLGDLPDDFYELTIEEVRRLYNDLQQHRVELENTPLLTSSKRVELHEQTSQRTLNEYKNVVVRIQFPDHIILQGVFALNNTIEDVMNFVKEHLENPDRPFHIFTTPLKEIIDPKMTLLEAKFVPCVHMHFKWLQENASQTYLKEEIYSKKTSSDAACILASKYRAPSRRKLDDTSSTSHKSSMGSSSTSKNSKVPKWFKK